MLNKGAFAFKIVRGYKMAALGRVTLNRGGRNSRFDCTTAWYCNMYGVYLFHILFTKFLLTQILEILMVNKLL